MRSAHDRLIDVINSQSPIKLVSGDVEFRDVKVNTNTDIDRNTNITVIARQNGKIKGAMPFYYNRLSLAKLFHGHTPILTFPYGSRVTKQDIAERLSERFGLGITREDIKASGQLYLNQFPTMVTLEAVEGGLLVVDSVEVRLEENGDDIGVVLGIPTLSGLNPPNGSLDKRQGVFYSWNWIIPEQLKTVVNGYNVGDDVDDQMVPWLTQLSGDNWEFVNATPLPFNLSGSKLVYRGNRDNHPDYATGVRRDEIAVIRLGDKCQVVGGDLVLSIG